MKRTWIDPSDANRSAWEAWLAARPERIRVVAERFDPWTVYRLKSTGQMAQFLGCDVGALNCGDRYCGVVITDVVDGSKTLPCRRQAEHTDAHDAGGDITLRIYVEHPELGKISGRQVFGIEQDALELWDAVEEEAN